MTVSRPLRALLGSASIAVAILFVAVLPAEYGFDPLGTGRLLGLTGLAPDEQTALSRQSSVWRSDHIVLELAPFESVEYKYRLAEGAAMVFAWQADDEVVVDLHSEPDSGAPGYAESFGQRRASSGSGSLVAPFDGIHGWFWQNRGDQTLSVHLVTAGFFTAVTEFREGFGLTRSLVEADESD